MTTPECEALAPLLSALIDDELTDEECALVERHLQTCASCRDRVSEYRAIGCLVRGLPAPEPPPTLSRRYRGLLAGERPDGERSDEEWHPLPDYGHSWSEYA
jgi:anti-sigma factor RsiW